MISFFPFEPTNEQRKALNAIESFVQEEDKRDFFILKGSAGTGKTSLLKAVCDYVINKKDSIKLAAPTGRASKILSSKTQIQSRTIHSLIYIPEPLEDISGVRMIRKKNTDDTFTVFIIDESSMISDYVSNSRKVITEKPLLTDLLDYVKQGNPKNKVLFVGDSYQLPPIVPKGKKAFSPALDANYLKEKFNWQGGEVQLHQVMRQAAGSYILNNAVKIREQLQSNNLHPNLAFRNVQWSQVAIATFMQLFDPENIDKVAIIAHRNRDVNEFNYKIRNLMGFKGSYLNVGELVMLCANWYSGGRTIYNGDSGIVQRIGKIEKFAGLNFAEVEIAFRNSSGQKYTVGTKVLLDVLHTEKGGLNFEQEKKLYHEVFRTNKKFRQTRNPSDDIYLSAMRLRYGYALTCHKAQGGEWENVLLHPIYRRQDLRWLYTAVTRAKKELYSWVA